MRTLIVILILAAFLQTTLLPLDLVLMVIILRSYIKAAKANLYLAFTMGLLISHLEQLPLGLHSLIYLGLVQFTHLLSRAPITSNSLTVIPLMATVLSISEMTVSFWLQSTPELWPKVGLEAAMVLPIYLLLRFLQERFVPQAEIKLKI